MEKKICRDCKREFIPIKPEHELCYECWDKYNRRCVHCNKIINGAPPNYRYCDECNYKLFHSNK